MKAVSRKSMVKKLDSIVKEIVLLRDGGRCVQCGTTNRLTPGHVFSRVSYSTRWDLDNVYAQCASDNLKHEYDAYPFLQVVSTKLGVDGLERLHRRYVTARPFKTWEMEVLYGELQLIRDMYKEKLSNKKYE